MTGAVFLDRDGVINQLVFYPDLGLIDTPLNPKQFKLISGVSEAIKSFNDLGFKVIVVSNQPGIAKGKMTPPLFQKIRQRMTQLLEEEGAHIDAEYYCLHHPKAMLPELKANCDCRKPKPGLILKATSDHQLDTTQSFMIGDGLTDIKAGETAGCKTVFIGELKCDLCRQMETMATKPHYIAANLLDASKIIENQVRKNGNIH
jgi:D-glycero-D-manno-heptose 1,7-bisphosphate phosphatase